MNNIKKILLLTLIISGYSSYSQEDLLNELDNGTQDTEQKSAPAFKGLQIATMQSTKVAAKSEWYFVVSHRFGDLTNGTENFFGLDNALTKIGGLYGVTNGLTLGFSRHTYNKIYEGSAKYKLIRQNEHGFPLEITGYATVEVNTKLKKEEYPGLSGQDKLAYTFQLPVSHKFSRLLSAEINPVYVHKNLYDPVTEEKDAFVLAGGGRYKLSNRMSINIEYAARLNTPKQDSYQNPVTLGFDLETGGHIFQMVLSNSQYINDVAYYTNTTGKPFKQGIFFGFNMYRVF